LKYVEGITKIRRALEAPLPGIIAQHMMAPRLRKTTDELLLENPDHRLSSVMILLYPNANGILSTVFIERPVNESVHSGQIAFPGGKIETSDANPQAAALRETEEEIGVPASAVECIGLLTRLFIPASKFLVIPHVGIIGHTPQFLPNPEEVKSIIQVDISELVSVVPGKKVFPTSYGNLEAPYYNIQGHSVWGATAMMLSEFREIIKGVE
jgi:8-oxo-dGTP pyrophosphatase MutT (NUDIX family)